MGDKQKKVSPETQKFLDDLQKKQIVIKPKEISTSDLDFEKEFQDTPRFVVVLCKILKPIFDILGFVYAIIGGVAALCFTYSVWKFCAEVGWLGIFKTWDTLYIAIYLVLLFVIQKIRFLIFKITYEN